MTYASLDDLIDRFGEAELIDLTDRADPPRGIIDPAVAADALDDADAAIDGYLAVRYALPLPSAPPLVKAIACDIARYRLHSRIAPTDIVRANYEDALKRLKDIAAGLIALPLPGAAAATAAADLPTVGGPARQFTGESLKGYTR